MSGTTDAHGAEVVTETSVDALCELQQTSANERGESGEVSDDAWRLFFAAGTDLSTASAVVVDNEIYEIVGTPWTVRNPRTQVDSHIEVKARRTAGAADGS